MPVPIIILRPSVAAFDWTIENSPAVVVKADPKQLKRRLNEKAWGLGAQLCAEIGGTWTPIQKAIASFHGKTLTIISQGSNLPLRWTLQGKDMTPVTPTFPAGWNAALDKVDPDSIVVVLDGNGSRASASAIKLEFPASAS